MSAEGGEPVPARGGAYTYVGLVHWEYQPHLDGDPDPGEIVWTWVAYEEDASVGKDRPVAVVGSIHDGRLAALMLSSQGHDGDSRWLGIGSGSWDRDGRPSWVRRDRMLAVPSHAVRREGAVIPPETFRRIVEDLARGQHEALSSSSARRAGVTGFFRRILRRT
jgi:hypothetical protein